MNDIFHILWIIYFLTKLKQIFKMLDILLTFIMVWELTWRQEAHKSKRASEYSGPAFVTWPCDPLDFGTFSKNKFWYEIKNVFFCASLHNVPIVKLTYEVITNSTLKYFYVTKKNFLVHTKMNRSPIKGTLKSKSVLPIIPTVTSYKVESKASLGFVKRRSLDRIT